ncbi:MAG: asparagine synthetase B [Chloroflexi bacterium]|nr:asparagine synthetase B [Chloroflexota bacterium]
MSAFAVLFNRSGSIRGVDAIHNIMERLRHRGPDGSNVFSSGDIAMGHWHFWTTPEDVGERQPLVLGGFPYRIVMDGRIDNREELFANLGIAPADGSRLSDASLVLRAFIHWGEECFRHFVGEFAAVIHDQKTNQLFCARDQLGERTLFYLINEEQVVVASEPWAVAGILKRTPEIDPKALAHYFVVKVPINGQTLFNDIYELLPAHILKVNENTHGLHRYWQPDPKKTRYNTDEEYATEFRSLLEQSIRCRMRSNIPAGILMSGGLDSTSVACLAARMTVPQQLTTISYVFDELPECDERQYINAVQERWNTRSIQITCDDAWPYKDWKNWPHNPNRPEPSPNRLLAERAYHRAHEEGLNVLLTGGLGDHLYDGAENALGDLLKERQFLKFIEEMVYHLLNFRRRHPVLFKRSLRRLLGCILDAIPGGRNVRRGGEPPYSWLTPFAKSLIEPVDTWLHPAFVSRGNILGLTAPRSYTSEAFYAVRHHLELRHPYRDRRLIEFVLSLPSYQLYSHGAYKYILRSALRGILPESIRSRIRATSVITFFF